MKLVKEIRKKRKGRDLSRENDLFTLLDSQFCFRVHVGSGCGYIGYFLQYVKDEKNQTCDDGNLATLLANQ